MSLLFIDDQGEIWNGDSRTLRSAFDSPYSGGEFSDYVVLNLGFLAVNLYGSSCQIRLRPSVVTDAAHRSLQRWLQEWRGERVILTGYDQSWSNELIRSTPLVVERLAEMIDKARAPRPTDFLTRDRTPAELSSNAALATIVGHWPKLSQPSAQHELMNLLEAAIGNRYVAVKKEPANGRIVFHEFGGGLFTKYETWRTCAVGAPIEEQPDRHYGRWITSTYQEIMEKGVPRVDDVDAIVRWPHAGRTRLRYRRIIVPVALPSAGKLLIGGSIMDNAIDLRVASR